MNCRPPSVSSIRKIVDIYTQNLSGIPGISVFEIPEGVKRSYQYFVIRIGDEFGRSRDEVYAEFKKYNIFARKYFYPLCSDYACYRHLPSSDPENLPVAGKIVREVLCLPLYGGLGLDEAEKICAILKGFNK